MAIRRANWEGIALKGLCEKLLILPRGKPMAGETLRAAASGSFWERAREAKGRKQRATADIVTDEDRGKVFRRRNWKEMRSGERKGND